MNAADFHRRSDARGIAAVLSEYALIALALLAAGHAPPAAYPLLALLVGTRQYALAEALTHEAAHRNLCASRHLNDLLGVVCAWPFFYVLSGYRRYHLDHHRVALDHPENNIREQYEDWGLPPPGEPLGAARAAWLLVGRVLVGVMAAHHLRTLISNLYWDRDLPENRLMLGTWALVASAAAWQGWAGELVLWWILPQLAVVGTLDYWSETADHYRVEGALTRSHLGTLLNRLVSHNIGYHALHHRYPGIPWFRLPQAHRALAGRLVEQTSTGFGECFSQIVAARPRSGSEPARV